MLVRIDADRVVLAGWPRRLDQRQVIGPRLTLRVLAQANKASVIYWAGRLKPSRRAYSAPSLTRQNTRHRHRLAGAATEARLLLRTSRLPWRDRVGTGVRLRRGPIPRADPPGPLRMFNAVKEGAEGGS